MPAHFSLLERVSHVILCSVIVASAHCAEFMGICTAAYVTGSANFLYDWPISRYVSSSFGFTQITFIIVAIVIIIIITITSLL
jgi:hypothetical protein